MRALYLNISILIALAYFLRLMWNDAPLEKSIFTGASIGMALYLVMIVGDALIQLILLKTNNSSKGPEDAKVKQETVE